MQTWEYRKGINLEEWKDDSTNVKYLNSMDKVGWELVSALKDSDNSYTQFYFKRKISPAKRGS